MPFAGLRVLSLESRRAREMEALIRKAGGDPFVAASVHERAHDDPAEALHFVERLESGEFDLMICMTGSGLTFWREQVIKHMPGDRLSRALRGVTIVSRGPKPLPILRELGARADVVVPEPNTWKEIVDVVAVRPERRILVQEYGRRNPELNAALERLGAKVSSMVIYRWDLPDDLGPLREAARGLAAKRFDVVLFTSSIQFDHLKITAEELGIAGQVLQSLREYTAVASVGPVMTARLADAGIPVDIVPLHPKMAALVKASSDGIESILRRKRQLAELD